MNNIYKNFTYIIKYMINIQQIEAETEPTRYDIFQKGNREANISEWEQPKDHNGNPIGDGIVIGYCENLTNQLGTDIHKIFNPAYIIPIRSLKKKAEKDNMLTLMALYTDLAKSISDNMSYKSAKPQDYIASYIANRPPFKDEYGHKYVYDGVWCVYNDKTAMWTIEDKAANSHVEGLVSKSAVKEIQRVLEAIDLVLVKIMENIPKTKKKKKDDEEGESEERDSKASDNIQKIRNNFITIRKSLLSTTSSSLVTLQDLLCVKNFRRDRLYNSNGTIAIGSKQVIEFTLKSELVIGDKRTAGISIRTRRRNDYAIHASPISFPKPERRNKFFTVNKDGTWTLKRGPFAEFMELFNWSNDPKLSAQKEKYHKLSLAAAMTGQGITSQLNIISGGGSNGKSKYYMLLEIVLGGYMKKIEKAILIDCKPHAPNSALMSCKGIRLGVIEEWAEKDTICANALKAVVGGEGNVITGRDLNERNSDFIMNASIALLCNKNPAFEEAETNAMFRRVGGCEQEAKFTDNQTAVDPKNGVFRANPALRKQFEKDEDTHTEMLIWLIHGLTELCNMDQIELPNIQTSVKDSVAAVGAAEVDEDEALQIFTHTCLEFCSPPESSTYKEIMSAFFEWCDSNGHDDCLGIKKIKNATSQTSKLTGRICKTTLNGMPYPRYVRGVDGNDQSSRVARAGAGKQGAFFCVRLKDHSKRDPNNTLIAQLDEALKCPNEPKNKTLSKLINYLTDGTATTANYATEQIFYKMCKSRRVNLGPSYPYVGMIQEHIVDINKEINRHIIVPVSTTVTTRTKTKYSPSYHDNEYSSNDSYD